MDENLSEYYYIYYISSELPSFMEENPRVKFYRFQLLSDKQDPNVKIKLMQRLIMNILHDLGMFYSQQAKDLSDDQENQTIKRELLVKGAKCYKLLANETEKIIQRYKNNETQ